MGRVHNWLKRSYIIVISLIVIISLLLLAISLFALGKINQQKKAEQNNGVIHFMYIFAIATIVLTIFGAFGVWKEKKWALIVFAVGMTLSTLFILVVTIQGLVEQPKLAKDMKKQYLDLLPLVNASEVLNVLQTGFECCGLEGYQDWNSSIPESCLCTEESTNPCVTVPRNSSLYNGQKDDLPLMIYEKGCLPLLIKAVMSIIRAMLGVTLAVLFLWVLSIVLCIAILCQLDRNKDHTAVN